MWTKVKMKCSPQRNCGQVGTGASSGLCANQKMILRWMEGQCKHDLRDTRGLMSNSGLYFTPFGVGFFKVLKVDLTRFIIHLYEGIGILRIRHVDGKEVGEYCTEYTTYMCNGGDYKVNKLSCSTVTQLTPCSCAYVKSRRAIIILRVNGLVGMESVYILEFSLVCISRQAQKLLTVMAVGK